MTASAPVAGPGGPAGEAGVPLPGRRRSLRASFLGRDAIRWVGGAVALLPTLALAFVLAVLIVKSIPAFRYNGFAFFTKSVWDQGGGYNASIVTSGGATHLSGADFGGLAEIVGTLLTSAIALIIAVPVSIGAALVIVERMPRRVASGVGIFLELLAGIPSVVIGLWGSLTFGPWIAHNIAGPIAGAIPDVPVLKYFSGAAGNGQGLLTSGLVLSIMIIPIVAATARDLIRQVPILPREGAVALGMSDAETARRVTLPWVGAGIVGAVVLGLGRALGETIAVAMVSGANFSSLSSNFYGAMTTIAASIVQNLDAAFTDGSGFAIDTIAELALILMIITLATNILARLLVRRVSGTALPVGRGF
ncbi:MAG TPA: phosphate ABC transporter permease subunit PstC [Streptosporangiaceae bacterium]|nr:phosphate ABC transporter permease subunit PstC [Streptosporangiaceae bacterium]